MYTIQDKDYGPFPSAHMAVWESQGYFSQEEVRRTIRPYEEEEESKKEKRGREEEEGVEEKRKRQRVEEEREREGEVDMFA